MYFGVVATWNGRCHFPRIIFKTLSDWIASWQGDFVVKPSSHQLPTPRSDGSSYEGNMEEGKMHGQGRFVPRWRSSVWPFKNGWVRRHKLREILSWRWSGKCMRVSPNKNDSNMWHGWFFPTQGSSWIIPKLPCVSRQGDEWLRFGPMVVAMKAAGSKELYTDKVVLIPASMEVDICKAWDFCRVGSVPHAHPMILFIVVWKQSMKRCKQQQPMYDSMRHYE